jgi:hypothetical protein
MCVQDLRRWNRYTARHEGRIFARGILAMRFTTTYLAVTAALLLTAGSALANPNCLRAQSFKSYTVPDNQTLIVRQGPNDQYKLTLAIKCQSLIFTQSVAVKQLTDAMCVTAGDRIVYTHGGIEQSCIISKVEQSTVPPPQPD